MIINGFKIHPELLEEVYAERCVLNECLGACCTGGAWLDVAQLKTIVPHVEAIKLESSGRSARSQCVVFGSRI